MMGSLKEYDKEVGKAMEDELLRQQTVLEMIPSENLVSVPVLKAMGSVLTNKYSEGYPHKRYYGGNEFIDEVEDIAIENNYKLGVNQGRSHITVFNSRL